MKLVPITTQSFFKRTISVAEHYGFRSVDELSTIQAPNTVPASATPADAATAGHRFDYSVLPQALRTYANRTELRKKQANMFYTPSVVSHPASPATKFSTITLSTVGVQDALSEVILLKTATSILGELGIKQFSLRINSIGDSDSSARFVRELTTQLRQKMHDIPKELHEKFRQNTGGLMLHLYESRHPIVANLPGPIDFLTAPSRKYFKEVLELLEQSDIPFELDDKLYGNHRTYSHTIFEIVEKVSQTNSTEHILARGGRYDNLTRSYTRSSVPAVGIVIAAQTKDVGGLPNQTHRKKPSACLVHIGRDARIRSMAIVEQFRREKIPIEQCFQYERFTEQIAYAEAHGIKYLIIMGQREASQGVVIVRNAIDRSQHNVPIDQLTSYLREHAV